MRQAVKEIYKEGLPCSVDSDKLWIPLLDQKRKRKKQMNIIVRAEQRIQKRAPGSFGILFPLKFQERKRRKEEAAREQRRERASTWRIRRSSSGRDSTDDITVISTPADEITAMISSATNRREAALYLSVQSAPETEFPPRPLMVTMILTNMFAAADVENPSLHNAYANLAIAQNILQLGDGQFHLYNPTLMFYARHSSAIPSNTHELSFLPQIFPTLPPPFLGNFISLPSRCGV